MYVGYGTYTIKSMIEHLELQIEDYKELIKTDPEFTEDWEADIRKLNSEIEELKELLAD
jgi:peptidoglycan hydrolase CwlO-like protein